MRVLGIALALGLLCADAQAEPIFVSGFGSKDCSDLISRVKNPDNPSVDAYAMAMVSWAQGYMSAHNVYSNRLTDKRYDLRSLTLLEVWSGIYGFCTRNPEDKVLSAVIDVMNRLKPYKEN